MVKKHSITVKAMNESIRDKEAVRRAFLCAFKAFPANSPSTPNKRERTGEFLLRLSWNSPVFLMASNGANLLNVRAGSHAEIHMVIIVTNSVRARTSGWYPNTASCLPATRLPNSAFIICKSPILIATPNRFPSMIGMVQSTAASCSRHVRICFGVAPMLEKMPNWWILAFMDTANELCIMTIREKEVIIIIIMNIGNSSLGAMSCGLRMRYIARSS